jgi:hypothetical protein
VDSSQPAARRPGPILRLKLRTPQLAVPFFSPGATRLAPGPAGRALAADLFTLRSDQRGHGDQLLALSVAVALEGLYRPLRRPAGLHIH